MVKKYKRWTANTSISLLDIWYLCPWDPKRKPLQSLGGNFKIPNTGKSHFSWNSINHFPLCMPSQFFFIPLCEAAWCSQPTFYSYCMSLQLASFQALYFDLDLFVCRARTPDQLKKSIVEIIRIPLFDNARSKYDLLFVLQTQMLEKCANTGRSNQN